MRWIALFIALPAAELTLLIEIGSRIGTFATLGLVVVTGVLGATLARRQGLRAAAEIRREVELGRLPADSLLDGLLILIAAALLITPGVLTDAVGFLCLAPPFRRQVVREIARRIERAIRNERVQVRFVSATGAPFADAPFADPHFADPDWSEIDVTPRPGGDRDDPTLH